MKIYLIALFCCFTAYGSSFAALSPSQIEKSMQLIDQNKDLRGRIEQPQKSFVKEVIVTAPFALDKKAVEQAALPYKGSWITKDDIKQLIEA
ncbi:MAG: hypothetical protein NTY47_04090, partial [Candidatus Omnitrophica bacterium]|nr:hypothetical protein [Candidatus Omnitrophota bacterium]